MRQYPHFEMCILEIFTSSGYIWPQEVNISNIHISKCGYWHYKQFYVHLSSLKEEKIEKKERNWKIVYIFAT